jgi:hypothetical protein
LAITLADSSPIPDVAPAKTRGPHLRINLHAPYGKIRLPACEPWHESDDMDIRHTMFKDMKE